MRSIERFWCLYGNNQKFWWINRILRRQVDEELHASRKGPENPTEQEIKHAKLNVKKEMLVCMFISVANKERYGDLKTKLLNDYAEGVNNWPTRADEA